MKNFAIAITLLWVSTTVCAQELPLGVLAVKIPQAAVAAVKLRDAGKPKEFLTNSLPAKGSAMTRVGLEMHQIADEFKAVKSLPYYAYTQARLSQELKGKPAPSQFKEIASEVLGCQDKISETEQQKLIQCVTGIVENYAPVVH
jgi:hypothetical protein